MATTEDGIEFYLIVVKPESPDVTQEELEGFLRRAVRTGDAVFDHKGDVFVAVEGQVPGAGKATRRITNMLQQGNLATKTYLVAEPFPPLLQEAAARVIVGNVRVVKREDVAGDVHWKD